VRDARLVRSIVGLARAALEAVRQWEYQPTIRNGEAVTVIFNVDVRFERR
jgi:outer membrane biosynthesis protein TonB